MEATGGKLTTRSMARTTGGKTALPTGGENENEGVWL